MTAHIIPITQHRVDDLRTAAARTEGFGMAIKMAMDKVSASAGPFTQQDIKLMLLLLREPE